MAEPFKIKVYRYDPMVDETPRFEEYSVEDYYKGMRVWRALDKVNETYRANIAWRLSCREYQCGSCTILINGKPKLACKTEVENGMVLEPLPYFPVVKDLLIDRDIISSRYQKIKPWLLREDDISKREMKVHQSDVTIVRGMTDCFRCMACISVCPTVKGAWDTFIGPMFQVNIAESAYNPLDTAKRVAEAFRYGLYNCTQCGACREICPKKIDIPEKAIGQMRTIFAEEGDFNTIKKVVESVKWNSNPFGRENTKRKWAEGLNLPKAGSSLFFAGCLSSFEFPDTLRETISLLRQVVKNVAYLAEDEICCHEPVLRLGSEEEFVKGAKDLLERFRVKGVKEVITGCSECFRCFKLHYPKYLPSETMPQFRHVTEVLWEGIEKLKKVQLKNKVRLTYHDPCRLGRDCGIYDIPRKLIESVGKVDLVEMDRSKEMTQCCGAGGGMKLSNPGLALDVGRVRLGEAKKTGSSILVSACPWCEWNFKEAMGEGNFLGVKNIVDLLAGNL
jgi:fumarate reductase (CoM/CoB) subunit B